MVQIQDAVDDCSDTPFSINWFVDSFKQQRNKAVRLLSDLELDPRDPAWPQQF